MSLIELLEEQTLIEFCTHITNQHCCIYIFSNIHLIVPQPQNILLTSDSPLGDIKIVDFGLSRMVSSNQELREIMGTPEYVGELVLTQSRKRNVF